MKQIGEIYKCYSGSYLLCKDTFSVHGKGSKYVVFFTESPFDFSTFTKTQHFYFKKDAKDFIEKIENEYLHSEPHLQSQVESGLLTKSEMLEILKKN